MESGPGGTGVASRPYRDFTQSKFTPQLAAANNGVVYLQKGEGPQSRSVAGHLTTAVRLPRARSHTWRWGGGVMTLFCPEGYVPVQVAIAGAAQSLVSGADDCARDGDGG